VGTPCAESFECPSTEQTCYRAPLPGQEPPFAPQGICSLACDQAGTTDRCPADSVCAATLGTQVCAPLCEGDGDCLATDFRCLEVPGSGKRACLAAPPAEG
jgi:hypothetical protein